MYWKFKVIAEQITFQEVPWETSLSFMISWCPLKCKWCHSEEQDKDATIWIYLNKTDLISKLNKYKWMITCVCFLGWEWHKQELIDYLKIVKENWIKTCLYTWLLKIDEEIKVNLDYLKTWPWIEFLWWLNSKTTNQKMFNLNTWENITHKFWKENI